MSISEGILKSLKLATDLLVEIDGLKYLPYRMMWGSGLQGYKRDSVQAVMSRLVKKGLIKKQIDQGQVYLALTELGSRALDKKHKQTKLTLTPQGEKWDGIYRFILFDIPESDRSVRDLLRRALRDIGAVRWQKSVWVTKENITRELNEFVDENGLDDYCSVLEVKEVYNLKLKRLLEVT